MKYHNKNLTLKSKQTKPIQNSFFDIGELVGFKNFFSNKEGTIRKSEYKNNRWQYTVKLNGMGESLQIFFEKEMFILPMTRKVLFEKYVVMPYDFFDTEDGFDDAEID